MATQEVITLHDDLDSRISTGVETVTFFHPVFGTKHEIELGEANRKHLANHLEKLQKYIDASREVDTAPVKANKPAGAKSDLTVVREWAKANGYTVGDRGRIKTEILEAFDKSQMPVAVTGDKVVLTVTPKAKAKLEEISDSLTEKIMSTSEDANAALDEELSEPTAEQLAEVEQDTEAQRELSDDEILALMVKADSDGGEVTLDKLSELANKS